MEKRKPHYALADVKAAFADPATISRSFVSKQGADALGMDNAAVVATIQALAMADFEKSITSHADHRVWQDVHRARASGAEQRTMDQPRRILRALAAAAFRSG